MRLGRANSIAMIIATAMFLWFVPAQAAEGCFENCKNVNIPGCSYTNCYDWGSGCYNCVFECESQCELWICPDENPDWECGDGDPT